MLAFVPTGIAEIDANTSAGHLSMMAYGQARLSTADESKLKAMIAQHQKLRLRLPEKDRNELDRLTALMRKQLFAALPRVNLLASATQMVKKIIPDLTSSEARSLAEYSLGGIAAGDSSGDAINAATDGSGQTELMNATKQMQETQMSFNLQYLQLQSQMQSENRSYTAISNIMKTKHDTVKNSISNIR
jgi:hypothetical protein